MIVFLSQAKPLPTVNYSEIQINNAPVDASNILDLNAIPYLFSNILAVAVALIGLASFAMLVAGGMKFLTSGGDQKAVEQAKGTITWAVGGLVLTILSYLIINYLGLFLGVNLLEFRWGNP